jgi:hypothetical protein
MAASFAVALLLIFLLASQTGGDRQEANEATAAGAPGS